MTSKEQETAMYDQPEPGSASDTALGAPGRSLGYDISAAPPEGFAKRVLDILEGAALVYRDRNAIYKDNFRMVGDTMAALFPDGRPGLKTPEDYNRWHIFELIIVKLTRYANNYDNPHADSLLDMLPYLGILGAQDEELRERIAKEEAVHKKRLKALKVQHTRDNEASMYAKADDEDELEIL